jgi:threonine synthase
LKQLAKEKRKKVRYVQYTKHRPPLKNMPIDTQAEKKLGREQEEKRRYFVLQCFSCKQNYEIDDYGKFYYCRKCGDLLEVKLVDGNFFQEHGRRSRRDLRPFDNSGVWKYLDVIPIWEEKNIVSLQEGGTLLLDCRALAQVLGLKSLFVKFEGQNPTGSFKDRGMTVGVSKAREVGYKHVICASTGNTSASLAAYSARANLACTVLIPKGKIALGKMAQAIAYGAEIVQVEGNFDDCLKMAREISEASQKILLLNSLNPFRIEGQKTTAFEIVEQLGFVPDDVILPVGNGGNISSLWKGFNEIVEFPSKIIEVNVQKKDNDENKKPRMSGIQAEGAAPIATAFHLNKKIIEHVKDPQTDASAINIGSPVSWSKALRAIYDSGGVGDSVRDGEIFKAQRLLASKEGLFVEPASAAPIAYLAKISKKESSFARERYEEMKDSTIVCIATGNGLKDPDAIIRNNELNTSEIKVVSADPKSLEKVLLL